MLWKDCITVAVQLLWQYSMLWEDCIAVAVQPLWQYSACCMHQILYLKDVGKANETSVAVVAAASCNSCKTDATNLLLAISSSCYLKLYVGCPDPSTRFQHSMAWSEALLCFALLGTCQMTMIS